jgi:hypothetical protein
MIVNRECPYCGGEVIFLNGILICADCGRRMGEYARKVWENEHNLLG